MTRIILDLTTRQKDNGNNATGSGNGNAQFAYRDFISNAIDAKDADLRKMNKLVRTIVSNCAFTSLTM